MTLFDLLHISVIIIIWSWNVTYHCS